MHSKACMLMHRQYQSLVLMLFIRMVTEILLLRRRMWILPSEYRLYDFINNTLGWWWWWGGGPTLLGTPKTRPASLRAWERLTWRVAMLDCVRPGIPFCQAPTGTHKRPPPVFLYGCCSKVGRACALSVLFFLEGKCGMARVSALGGINGEVNGFLSELITDSEVRK